MAKKKPENTAKNAQRPNPSSRSISRVILESALNVAHSCDLQSLLLYMDGLKDIDDLQVIDFSGSLKVILVAQSESSLPFVGRQQIEPFEIQNISPPAGHLAISHLQTPVGKAGFELRDSTSVEDTVPKIRENVHIDVAGL